MVEQSYSLEAFLKDCRVCCEQHVAPADIVAGMAPRMARLLNHTDSFLKPEHFKGNDEHYARNAVYICPEGALSVFTMVWNPGQFTPVHDHSTWGVVGVVRGILEERAFIRTDNAKNPNADISLAPGGLVLVGAGSVTTFIPAPDHIHRTGVPKTREQCVSLHLYGRDMDNFNVYDLENRCRRKVDVACTHVG